MDSSELGIVTLKALALAVIADFFGLYSGAFMIAFIAAMMRVFYGSENCFDEEECKLCCRLWLFARYFSMSLGVSMLFVHIGLWQTWPEQKTIVLSGVAAFLGREIVGAAIELVPSALRQWLATKLR